MIERNTMQRGNDIFRFRRQALFKVNDPFDTNGETAVRGFVIHGVEPAGSNRRVIFSVDNELFYFTNDGLTAYNHYGELSDILTYGNTVAELLNVDAIPQWINKKIYPIVAMDAPANSRVMPKLKLALKVDSFNDVYQKEVFSPVCQLKHNVNPAKIISIDTDKLLNGYAYANVSIRIQDKFGNWSDFIQTDDAKGKEAIAVQFKVLYSLTTLDGSDEVLLKSAVVAYSTDAYNPAGNTLEIITNPISYADDLHTVYALINHSELVDCDISAFVTFKRSTSKRFNLPIGIGSGSLKTYYLGTNGGIDPNIDHDSIVIKVDGVNSADYFYNTANSTVDINAPTNSTITASYNYNVTPESWLPMSRLDTTSSDGVFSSRFFYRADQSDLTNSAVKFVLNRKSGSVSNFSLGYANGKTQRFALEHRAMAETLTVPADVNVTYDEDCQLLDVTAPVNAPITISYDWCGSFPDVFKIIAGWSV